MYLEIKRNYNYISMSSTFGLNLKIDYEVIREVSVYEVLDSDKKITNGIIHKSENRFIIDCSVYEGGSESSTKDTIALNKCINDYIIKNRDKEIKKLCI